MVTSFGGPCGNTKDCDGTDVEQNIGSAALPLAIPDFSPTGICWRRNRRLDDGSRMSGDVQVRFCERLGVKIPRPTHRNLYVRSERAGKRVMASVVNFIERRLRLKVNAAKSAV